MQEYNFTQIAIIEQAVEWVGPFMLFGDTDHDGLNEMIFSTPHWEFECVRTVDIWECRPGNKYELDFMYHDSLWEYHISFHPYNGLDIDGDGLSDVIIHRDSRYSPYVYALVFESPDFHSYPTQIVWVDSTAHSGPVMSGDIHILDFDKDGKNELFLNMGCYLYILENTGDNEYNLVSAESLPAYGLLTFGDFDNDGKIEFVQGKDSDEESIYVFENDGDNSFRLVWKEHVSGCNGYDIFSGDTDGDSKPEFFISFHTYWDDGVHFTLHRYRAIENNYFERTLIDSIIIPEYLLFRFYVGSCCGDVDGDDIEEILWSIGHWVYLYKRKESGEYERIWEWRNRHTDLLPFRGGNGTYAFVYDLNKNGYGEIILSGCGKTSIYESDKVPRVEDKNLSSIPDISFRIVPNPFNAVTSVKWQVIGGRLISIEIYDVTGKLVRTLTRTQSPESRAYTAVWDGRDDRDISLANGVYFIKLEVNRMTSITKKLILQK